MVVADRTLVRELKRGTAAQRAAYTPFPYPIVAESDAGYVWYETDTGLLWSWTGAAWACCGAIGPGSATSGDLAQFADATGKVLADSGVPAAQVARKDQTLLFTPDTTNDIGAVASGRLRDLYVGRDQNIVRNLNIGGYLAVTGGQINFPATQIASAGANVFDDYREGTWTPTLTGSSGTPTYSVQTGEYVKGSRLLIAVFQITLGSVGTLTGTTLTITLPFTIGTLPGSVGYEMPIYFHALATNWIALYLSVSGSSATGTIYGMKAAGTSSFASGLAVTDLTNSSVLRGVLAYPTAS